MKKKKKVQTTEVQIKRERERSQHLIQCKIKEIEALKKEIEALKEINALNEGVIQVITSKCIFGVYVREKELSLAIKNPNWLKVEKKKNGFKLKAR